MASMEELKAFLIATHRNRFIVFTRVIWLKEKSAFNPSFLFNKKSISSHSHKKPNDSGSLSLIH